MKTFKLIGALAAAGFLAACGQGQDAAKTEAAAPAADAAAPAAAPATDPASVIKARQDNLKKFGAANRAMADELKKPAPDMAVFQTSAATISALAPDLINWFPAGTGAEAGVKTAAKPEVWDQPDLFKEKHAAFAAEAAKFQTTVNSGDMEAIKLGVPALGATCRGCHEVFRVRD
jgi:cytochrome c556